MRIMAMQKRFVIVAFCVAFGGYIVGMLKKHFFYSPPLQRQKEHDQQSQDSDA